MATNSRNCISRGGVLSPGEALISLNGSNVLTMLTSGNLVLTYNGNTSWQTNTSGSGNYLAMSEDGTLAIYAAGGSLVNTIAPANNGIFLIAQNDGNLVEYTQGTPVFATNTNA